MVANTKTYLLYFYDLFLILIPKHITVKVGDYNVANIAELDFSLDNFRNQKVLRNAEAYSRLIERLLFMKKGTYPTIPNMGVDISSYRFADLDTITAGDLKNTIQEQIDTYIEGLPLQDISISTITIPSGTVLYIDISILGDVNTIAIAMLQEGYEILGVDIKVEKPRLINVPRKR